MLATSKNVLFAGPNHLLTTGVDDPHFITFADAWEIIKVSGSSATVISRRLGPGNRTFSEVASMVVTWWIVAFLHYVKRNTSRSIHRNIYFSHAENSVI